MGYLSIKNWERFQHYKDRDPPWVKLYRDILSSEAWVLGTDHSRLVQLASILIAARYSNQIPLKWGLILKVCSLDMSEKQLREAVEALRGFGFLEVHKDQEDTSDASTGANSVAQRASTPLATCPSEADQSRDRSDQIRSDTSQSATAVARGTIPDWFLDFKLAYPDRAGDQRWREAQRAGRARIAEGHTTAEFIAGAERYAAFIETTGKANTEYVQQAATFLGPGKPFLNPWTAPAPTAVADPMQEFRRNLGLKPNGADHVGKTFEHEPEDTRGVGLFERALRTG